jgi:hypothetical protein
VRKEKLPTILMPYRWIPSGNLNFPTPEKELSHLLGGFF